MGDPKPIREIRKRIIGLAEGVVLEIGAGSGANFAHYDPTRVTKLYALEPNPGMIRLAVRQRLRTQLDVEYLDLPGERIPLKDRSVDSIVSTFTLGTIPDVLAALRGMRRVLRPGGRLIFSELGLSAEVHVRRWQERWEPCCLSIFRRLALDSGHSVDPHASRIRCRESGIYVPRSISEALGRFACGVQLGESCEFREQLSFDPAVAVEKNLCSLRSNRRCLQIMVKLPNLREQSLQSL
jgi:SAM-dependent methyltransferase